ncbi:MAG: hypothetical protein HFJ09_08540 [Lachnospiraceae bacterium]|nr:hypothetical protein [Lachnospiraceae bacterium]
MIKIDLNKIADGDLHKKVQAAFEDVVKNMKDPKTPWKNTREIKIKLSFTQNEDRDQCVCNISVEKKLANEIGVQTSFEIGKFNGEVYAQEYDSKQMSITEFIPNPERQNVDKETGEIVESKEKA